MRSAVELVRETISAYTVARGPRMAAALSYYTIFSLAPLLIIVVAFLGLFFGQAAARAELMEVLHEQAGAGIAGFIEGLIVATAQENSQLATIIGFGILIFASTNLFAAMQDALNTIWQVDRDQGSGIWRVVVTRLLALGLVAVIAVIAVLALAIQTLLGWLADMAADIVPDTGFLIGLGEQLLILAVVTTAFVAIHKLLVHRQVGWAPVLIGALVTAILFRIGQVLISLYLTTGAVGSAFGAAGSLVALLLFVYYSMQIFLLGTAFTFSYASQQVGSDGTGARRQSEQPAARTD